jgi:hypothetical protein
VLLPSEGAGDGSQPPPQEQEPPTHIVHWDPDELDKGLPRRLLRRFVCGMCVGVCVCV